MRKYWYRRILIMAVVFSVAVGGSYYLIRNWQEELKQEVNAGTAGSGLVIPGGMPIGIYLETDGVMALGTQAVPGTGGIEKEPARNLVSAGDYITAINGTKIRKKTELIEAVNQLDQEDVVLDIERDGSETKVRFQAAGGIVQGMSRRPIIQNGELTGAVTHVFVKDSSRGYGIFIENMLKNVDSP